MATSYVSKCTLEDVVEIPLVLHRRWWRSWSLPILDVTIWSSRIISTHPFPSSVYYYHTPPTPSALSAPIERNSRRTWSKRPKILHMVSPLTGKSEASWPIPSMIVNQCTSSLHSTHHRRNLPLIVVTPLGQSSPSPYLLPSRTIIPIEAESTMWISAWPTIPSQGRAGGGDLVWPGGSSMPPSPTPKGSSKCKLTPLVLDSNFE